jgi:hypothetical protein
MAEGERDFVRMTSCTRRVAAAVFSKVATGSAEGVRLGEGERVLGLRVGYVSGEGHTANGRRGWLMRATTDA